MNAQGIACQVCGDEMVHGVCNMCGWDQLPNQASVEALEEKRQSWLYVNELGARGANGPSVWLQSNNGRSNELYRRYWAMARLTFERPQYDPIKRRFYASLTYDAWTQQLECPTVVWFNNISPKQATLLVNHRTLTLFGKLKRCDKQDFVVDCYVKCGFGELGVALPASPFNPSELYGCQLFDIGHGVLIDPEEKLLWTRFAFGQRWVNGTAMGEPKEVSWVIASVAGDELRLLGRNHWKLPSLADLNSLTAEVATFPYAAFIGVVGCENCQFWSAEHLTQGTTLTTAYTMSFVECDKPSAYRISDAHPILQSSHAIFCASAPTDYLTAVTHALSQIQRPASPTLVVV